MRSSSENPKTTADIGSLSTLEKAAMLSGETTWQTRALPRLGVRQLWMSDGPHGIRRQAGSADHLGINASQPATCFPTSATVANSWDPVLAERVGRALGREASHLGVDVLLGPDSISSGAHSEDATSNISRRIRTLPVSSPPDTYAAFRVPELQPAPSISLSTAKKHGA